MNSSELIDKIFEGVLDVSEVEDHMSGELDLELPPVSFLSPLTKSLALQAAISPLVSLALCGTSSVPASLHFLLSIVPAGFCCI